MRYSPRTRCGLRFLINLASRPEGSCVQLGEIAREEGVSVKYLEQIVRILRPAGLLRSVRGARGGYALARPPRDISMEEVFEHLEGQLSPVDCLGPDAPCGRAAGRPTQWFWKAFDAHARGFLRGVTLDRFVEGKGPAKGQRARPLGAYEGDG